MRSILATAPLALLLACNSEPPTAPAPAPVAAPAPAPKTAKVPLSSGTVSIVARKNGDTDVPARFDKVTGQFELDPSDLSSAHGTVTIDLGSWASDEEVRDQRMRETFFDVATNPTTNFELTSVTDVSGPLAEIGATATGTAHGTLHWRQVSQDLTVPVSVQRDGASAWKVTTPAPFDVSIAALGMQAPLDALIKLCEHKSIDDSIKVSLDLQVGVPPTPAADQTPSPPKPLVTGRPRQMKVDAPRDLDQPTPPSPRPMSKPDGK